MDNNDIELMTFMRKVVLSTNTPKELKENALDILLKQAGAVVDISPGVNILKTVHAYIMASLADGQKIRAIKQLRIATGLGLVEAKKIIDEIQTRLNISEEEEEEELL
ncbi:hypothetical protein LCGC14_1726040 [marine sediment metagenome]|uniref:Large ribosomal subunit protein bL12 C-terminal domain-containing protein n=1 Tax=marine sediment metagenome TaxID=412755 RepID=A0A0F9JRK5_9ZZZZ